jgi:hypothetical protein
MAGKKTFVAGEVLTAQDVNDYLMDQSVMNFATVAARSSAIPTPTTGMVSYVGDVYNDSATNATVVNVPQIQAYTGASWQNIDGLTLVAKANVGSAVSNVTLINVFSSSFENYKIIWTNGNSSVTGAYIGMQLRTGTTTAASSYWSGAGGATFVATYMPAVGLSNSSSWPYVGGSYLSDIFQFEADIFQPFTTEKTMYRSSGTWLDKQIQGGGFHNVNASYDQLVITPETGTITGGTIYVYGYRSA